MRWRLQDHDSSVKLITGNSRFPEVKLKSFP
jgi:hypothetical protein